ncbi:RsbR, positive regulator of sigma-B [Enhygromyxa salina]|uniref:RsbR, positive regulator of sigma-B n=1 Tax=Enhygromyxa salina TaxID=215803 RepID=A0A0C2A7Q1_9BACT|nr:STAS domain-containing protein [Enhygromyxa salina]KIG19638.1 RsbR, positive regulator of sigma-B [Enhygromyxa salina]
MRCEGTCLLESEAAQTLELDPFLAQLSRCDDCPHASADNPIVRLLFARASEAGRAHQRLLATIRKLEHEAAEVSAEVTRYDAQIAKLEHLQQVSSQEIEAALVHQVGRVRDQEREIEALSVPIIRILEGTIVLPIIGALTASRARILTERLLDEVARSQIHTPIIDVTGVGDIDTATANHLIRMIEALRLLGAQPILTGVTPEVAQSLVSLGVDLVGYTTLRSVRQALRYIARGSHGPTRDR